MGGGNLGATPSWVPDSDGNKSPTDPCPPGYRVPSSSVWYSEKQSNMNFGNSYFTYIPVISLSGVSLDPIYYPYSECLNVGYIQSSGKKFLAANHSIEYSDPLVIMTTGTQYKLICDVYYTTTSGAVWSNSNSSLYYQYNGSRTIQYTNGQKGKRLR